MQGSQQVIDYMNELLAGELLARDQYFLHAQRYEDWGYQRLYEHAHHEMQEETEHAAQFMRRILMLGGTPVMRTEGAAYELAADVPGMLKADLNVEYEVRTALKKGIALCEAEGDYVSRDIMVAQLRDTEEDHAHWLEQQLWLIDQLGLANYLQKQVA